MHLYDSIVVIEKREITAPFDIQIGQFTTGYVESGKKNMMSLITYKIGIFIFKVKNRMRSLFYK
jgi:hypothetical protein